MYTHMYCLIGWCAIFWSCPRVVYSVLKCIVVWMSHVSYLGESWNTSEWVMSHTHIRVSMHAISKEDFALWLHRCRWVMLHISQGVMAHMWVRHGTHTQGGVNMSCRTSEGVMTYTWMSYITHTYTSKCARTPFLKRLWLHRCERVMVRAYASHFVTTRVYIYIHVFWYVQCVWMYVFMHVVCGTNLRESCQCDTWHADHAMFPMIYMVWYLAHTCGSHVIHIHVYIYIYIYMYYDTYDTCVYVDNIYHSTYMCIYT